jgi:hypothetical protein
LHAINKNIDATIKHDDKAIAKIETFSKEYHMAGRHLKNMGRVLTGKPPIDAVKESGKLSKAVSAPYRANRAINLKLKVAVIGMIGGLDRLEQSMAAKREKTANTPIKSKLTLSEKLKAHREMIKQKDLEKPMPERARAPGIEV